MKRSVLIPVLLLGMAFCIMAGCARSTNLKPLPADAVVLAFGDSLTYGSGAAENESYPAVLEQLTGHRVLNYGIPGETSGEGLARLPAVLEREKPALLLLCEGANDILRRMDHAQAAENLRAMVRLARERNIDVVLIAVPDFNLTLAPPKFYGEVATEFNLPIEARAFPRILGKSSLKADYVHPNGAGYRQLAEAIAALLRKEGAIN